MPLQPHNGGIEPDWTWCGDEFTARKEAVERVSGNFEAIVKFASRGAGKKGMPPVSAALADPNAVSSEAVYCSLDVLLRAISVSMLRGNETIEKEMSEAIYLIQSAGEDGSENATPYEKRGWCFFELAVGEMISPGEWMLRR